MAFVWFMSYVGVFFIGGVCALTALYAVVEHYDRKEMRLKTQKPTDGEDFLGDVRPFNLVNPDSTKLV